MFFGHTNDRTLTNFAANISYVIEVPMRDVENLPLAKELFDSGDDWRDAIEPIRAALQVTLLRT